MTRPSGTWPTLGAYLAFAFSLLSVLLTGLLVGVIERDASDRIGSGIGANLAELASQTASRLDRGVFERYREIELLASRAAVLDAAQLQRDMSALQASYRFYAWIGLADAGGRVVAASGGRLVGATVGDRPWFQQAKAGRFLDDVHPEPSLATRGAPPPVFTVAFPVAEGRAGVVAAHVSWAWSQDVQAAIFRPVGRAREVDPLILSADGTVLMGNNALPGRRLTLESTRRAQAGERGHAIEEWPDGRRHLVGFARTRGHERSPGLGWTVLVRQELDAAYAPVRALQRNVILSGASIALLFSLLGWLVARGITGPLLDLAKSARTLEERQDTPLPRSRAYSEVAVLGDALTSLVGKLRHNEVELRELNTELERRVQARTAELQAAFERVQASEQRIRTILETAQDPFIGIDLLGRIIDWNSQAEAVFGWRRDEVLGKRVGDTLLPARFAGTLEHALQEFLDTGSPTVIQKPIERLMVDRHGREIEVEVKIGFVSSGETRFFSAFVHDITERKEVERLKDEFVSTVSHELRTPLTAIYASLDLLRAGLAGELPQDANELIAISHTSTQRLVRLINDMLDVDKIASGKLEYRMQRQALRPLLEQAVRDTRPYAESLGVEYRLLPGFDAEVACDADRLVQVCVNLLSNAAKFSPRGEMVEVGLAVEAGMAHVRVVDRGPGIAPEFRSRVFQRFAQADATDRRAQGGTGLGLSICRSIVEAHGGRIDFMSEPGVETVFWFELPVA